MQSEALKTNGKKRFVRSCTDVLYAVIVHFTV